MLTFKLNINRQTFNKNIATAEKSPIFTSHKSYSNSLYTSRQKKENPTARKSTFGFSNRISQRSKNQKSFHFPTTTHTKIFYF